MFCKQEMCIRDSRKDDLELLQTHKRIDMQETYLSATGKARIVQTLKALVPMEGRKPLLIGISWDITNLQNIEQELIKARIKAEQSDRLKSCLLYTSAVGYLIHFVQTKVFRIFPDNDAALFNIEVDNGIGFIKNDKR